MALRQRRTRMGPVCAWALLAVLAGYAASAFIRLPSGSGARVATTSLKELRTQRVALNFWQNANDQPEGLVQIGEQNSLSSMDANEMKFPTTTFIYILFFGGFVAFIWNFYQDEQVEEAARLAEKAAKKAALLATASL
ncbi:unnamed protein product [Polarella glacialis]|uniref:Uncharacterized protein n=1 Tax=Polarella glacialis TaxID=89957 RepID=A0A813FQD2_POLGL|nr:unnamed protein product [Polarella glacialis]CAE8743785.1 unnamed protein product [Polarella glacialis]|mmetsp:Transcript_525/g.923  ORF Transcript_525/g.923 Transcript_525/m.923 type:complete len:138 (+) Transcript_525:70-483(+)